MRNLEDYQQQYEDNYPYEPYQIRSRRLSILNILREVQASTILEVGCGFDPLFRYIDKFEKYTAVDPGESFADTAIEFAKEHPLSDRISVVNEYFEGKKEHVKDFDFIICAGLLHELMDQQEFMGYLYDVADQDSIVHINVPNANSFHRLLAVKAGLIESVHEKSEFQERFQQHNIFTMAQLKELAESVGFKVQSEGTIAFKPFTHNQMQALIDQNILDEKIIFALSEMVEYCPELGSEIYVNLTK